MNALVPRPDLSAAARADMAAEPTTASRPWAVRVLVWSVALAALWAALNPGDLASWIVGAPAVGLGAALATCVPQGRGAPVSPVGALRFAGYFVRETVRGAWDVARRALHPRTPLAPGFLFHRTELPKGAPRTLFIFAVTLLPGTFVAAMEDDVLTVHTIDLAAAPEIELAALEARVAAMFARRAAAPGPVAA